MLWDLDINILQIVLSGAGDGDEVGHSVMDVGVGVCSLTGELDRSVFDVCSDSVLHDR